MKIGLIGYFGYGNIGDEAILKYELRDLKKHLPFSSFTIITNQCKSVDKKPCIPLNLDDILNENFDLILWGGGWILYDIANNQKAFIKEVNLLDQLNKKFFNPIGLYGVSVGPIKLKEDIALSRKTNISDDVNFAIVRDKQSTKYLKKIGFKKDQIKLGADFGYEVNPSIEKSLNLPSNFILLSLSNFINKSKVDLTQLISFLNQQELPTIIIPAQYQTETSDDLIFAKSLNRQMHNSTVLGSIIRTPENIAGILSKANYVITNRLHIAILASVSGTPSIGINSPKKLDFFYKDIKQKQLNLKTTQITNKKLLKLSKYISSKKEVLTQQIQSLVLVKRQQSLSNAQTLVKLIRELN